MVDIRDMDINSAEWKGYVKRALESIDKTLVSIEVKIDDLEDGVGKMKLKVAAIGGTVSLVVTLLCLVIKEVLAK